jgi:hypothetical protein
VAGEGESLNRTATGLERTRGFRMISITISDQQAHFEKEKTPSPPIGAAERSVLMVTEYLSILVGISLG